MKTEYKRKIVRLLVSPKEESVDFGS